MGLGDHKIYVFRRHGSTSLKLDNGSKMHLNNILYVPCLKRNLLYISCLEDKGKMINFVDGKVLVWKELKYWQSWGYLSS